MRRRLSTFAFLSTVVFTVQAVAAGPSTATAPPAAPVSAPPAAASPTTKIDDARKHYEAGLQLYSESNFEAALVEMQRAYQIAPSYRILYNLGRIHRQLNTYAAAIREFEDYLKQGGSEIPPERQAEVEQELTLLRARVVRVIVGVNVPDAEIYVDDVSVGHSPLTHPLVVDPGLRKITATKSGYAPATQAITAVPPDAISVRLDLQDLTRPVERHADPAWRNRAIVTWGVTAGLVGASAVFGVLALNANDKLSTERATFGVDPGELTHQSHIVKTWSYLCDGFAAGAIVGALAGTYFTIRAVRAEPGLPSDNKGEVRVGIGPMGVGAVGKF